jgi:hypothetical protein
MRIKLPDGSYESIALLDPAEARVNLGIAFSPAGSDVTHLRERGSAKDKWKSIQTRAELWLTRLKNSHLPSKYAWVSYRFQLWASIKYGLGVLASPLKELGEISPGFAFNALPSMGVNRNIRAGWRYLHSSFGGVGLLDLATETAIARLNMFLQHWDNPAPIGISLRTSMEYLQLEIGCRGCPLDESFDPMGDICTDSWVKSLWECVRWFGFNLRVDYPVIPFPRENDLTIMFIAVSCGYRGERLRSINRCCLFCHALFLSDIATANGKRLDPLHFSSQTTHTFSSTYSFP